MPVTSSSTFTCDRDGFQATAEADGPMVNPPKDWVRLLADSQRGDNPNQPTQNMNGFLCPTCAEAFFTFMDQPGGSGVFKK